MSFVGPHAVMKILSFFVQKLLYWYFHLCTNLPSVIVILLLGRTVYMIAVYFVA